MTRLRPILLVAALAACGGDDAPAVDAAPQPDADTTDADPLAPDAGPQTFEVSEDMTDDAHWTFPNTYILKNHIFVESGTLTIDAGVIVKGDSGSSLVITQNARIDAQGTAERPIVFTSSQPEGTRATGDWGGVVLLGKAPINVAGGTNKVEGFPASELRTGYGGLDVTHDCGTLTYARIEFAGFQLAPNNELNGLTMAGCGGSTEIDYVQLHLGQDDGVEMFGGTANLKHILITQPDDDGLDWDFGWVGRVQFLIVQQNALVGDKGFESDNNPNVRTATPESRPIIYNVSLIGSNQAAGTAGKTQTGMHFKNGTAGEIHNVILAHFTDNVIDVQHDETVDNTEGTAQLFLKNSIFFDNGNQTGTAPYWNDGTDNDGGFVEGDYFLTNEATNMDDDPMLTDALNLDDPDFRPMAGSPALEAGNAAAPPDDGFFDPAATFIGAMGTDDWTAGWTAYPEN
jgi:hypothetical protein